MEFGANGPLGARRGLFHFADNFAGGTFNIGQVHHFHRTFRMNQNFDAGVLVAELLDVFGTKHLMDAAMALPQHNAAVLQLGFGVAAEFEIDVQTMPP